MNATRHEQNIGQSPVPKSSITRMQTFIDSGDSKMNEIQVRFDDIQGIFDRYDTAQNELGLSNDTDQFVDREIIEKQYYEFKAKFSELLHSVINTTRLRNSSLRSRGSKKTITLRGHIRVSHTISYLPLHFQHSKVTHVAGYNTQTHLRQ